MVGHDLTDLELKLVCDGLYLLSGDTTIILIDEFNRWTCHRHPDNARGELSTVESMCRTVEEVGTLPDQREPPWWVKHPKSPGHKCLLGGATLYAEGAYEAWIRDINMMNRNVQISVRMPIKRAKQYSDDTPCSHVCGSSSTVTLSTGRSTHRLFSRAIGARS